MKDESPFAAVHRVLEAQFGIKDPDNIKTMILIDAVRDALPPHPQATIASLRAILRDLRPTNALEGWTNRMSREIVEYLSRLAIVHNVAVAVDDERMWCSLEGMISGMLHRVTQGKDLEQEKSPLWDNNLIQFARLLCEIVATQEKLNFGELCASMDLAQEDLEELLERAHVVWERSKEELRMSEKEPLVPYSPREARLAEERDEALARAADAEQRLRHYSWTTKA